MASSLNRFRDGPGIGTSSKPISKKQLPHHNQCLPDDRLRHLRTPLKPIREDDGDLFDPKPTTPDLVGELDLETVTIRPDLGEIDAFQGRPPEAFEPPGGIGERHAGDKLYILGRAQTQNEPVEGPIDHSHSIAIPGADHQIGFGRRLGQKQ